MAIFDTKQLKEENKSHHEVEVQSKRWCLDIVKLNKTYIKQRKKAMIFKFETGREREI